MRRLILGQFVNLAGFIIRIDMQKPQHFYRTGAVQPFVFK